MSDKRKYLWLLAILVGEALLFLWKSGHFFNGDSLFFFSHRVYGWADIWNVFKAPDHLWQYRPLTFVIFSYVLYPLFGLNTLGHNIFPLFVHAANTCMVFGILRALGLAERAALLGTFFFGTHCVAFYVTHGVEFLPDLSYSFFYLLSVLLFVQLLRSGRRTLLVPSLLFFVLALFCKEATVTLPIVVTVIAFFWGREGFNVTSRLDLRAAGLAMRKAVPYLFIGAVYLGFHWIVKAGQIYAPGADHPHNFELSVQALRLKYKYLKWALNLPDGLVFKFEGLTNYLVALAVLVFVLPFVLSTLRRVFAADRLVWCGLIWFAVALSPVLLLRNLTMHHNLYVPLVGLAMVFGDWLGKVMDRLEAGGRKWAPMVIPVFVLFFMAAVFHHNLNAVRHSWIGEASIIAETSLRDFQTLHPVLPNGATIFIMNRSSLDALQWFYDYGSLFTLFYPAKSLDIRFVGKGEMLPQKMPANAIVVQYDGSHISDVPLTGSGQLEPVISAEPSHE